MSEFEHDEIELVRAESENQDIPLLVKNFDAVRSSEVAKPPLESFPTLLDSVDYRRHCFEETKKAWLNQFDPEEFEYHLRAKPSKEHFRYLKQTRRYGSILRNMYRFFEA